MVRYLSYPLTVAEERQTPVKRRPIRIGEDAPAQNFARILGAPTMLPGQSDEGYGDKITTDREVRVGSRWYRVYATCWGNAGSAWIMYQGSRLYL